MGPDGGRARSDVFEVEVVTTETKSTLTTDPSHTPGPWKVIELCVDSVTHGNICLVNLARSSKADLNLIATAPDLLAALRACADRMAIAAAHGAKLAIDEPALIAAVEAIAK